MKSAIEGVETQAQSLAMQSLGFSFQQGYYHSRPQPLAYFLKNDLHIKR
jgi:EAL domain-containing protein (putative c-di-GMP-specific phosphodiesterase class I)